MIMTTIVISGFSRIYEGYKLSRDTNRHAYGSDFLSYLNHAMVSITVGDLSTIEVFYIKKLASNVNILEKTFSNFIKEDTNKEGYEKVQSLLELRYEILDDDDIDSESTNVDYMLPIGCERYKIQAVFKGASIASILGIMMDDLFIVDDKFAEVYPGDKYVQNRIAEKFYKNLYKSIGDQIPNVDVVTEFMINKKFYQYSESEVDLAYVNSPYGSLSFFGNAPDKLSKQVNEIKETEKLFPNFDTKNIYLTFVLNTTFSTFFKLYTHTNYIIDYQNLNIVYSSNDMLIDESIANKYKSRIQAGLNSIGEFKKTYNPKGIDLNIYNYICNGDKIKYSLQIPISSYNELEELLKEETELLNIKEKIQKCISTINTLIC